jgi:hypothetical protein
MLAAEAPHAAGDTAPPSSSSSSLTIGALPQQGAPSSGLHPLVLLNRQEFGAAAEEHLSLMLKQLLAAEDVQQAEVRMQWVSEVAGALGARIWVFGRQHMSHPCCLQSSVVHLTLVCRQNQRGAARWLPDKQVRAGTHHCSLMCCMHDAG